MINALGKLKSILTLNIAFNYLLRSIHYCCSRPKSHEILVEGGKAAMISRLTLPFASSE
jgi:hypothetical protein